MFIAFFVIFTANLCLAQQNPLTIAVLDFQNNSLVKDQQNDLLSNSLAKVLTNALSQAENITVIDRINIKSILQEKALTMVSVSKDSSLKELGKLSGAQYIVLGSFVQGFNNEIRIDCRIIKTESGITVKAQEITGKFKDIFKITEKLSMKLLDDLDIAITDLTRKSIKNSFRSCSHENIISYSLALGEVDCGNYEKATKILENLIRECPDFYAADKLLTEIKKLENSGF